MRPLLIGLAIAVGVWLAVVGVLFLFGRRLAAKELVTLLPHLIRLFRGLVRDPRVSRGSKVWLVVGAAWLASPIDLIPEFIPVLGPLDDAVVAVLVLRHVIRRAGPEVVAEHWKGDPATLRRLLRLAGVRAPRAQGGDEGT
ncbi:MAG: YkvA family protein [Actinomycetota bacterium]